MQVIGYGLPVGPRAPRLGVGREETTLTLLESVHGPEDLKQLERRRKELIDQATRAGRGTGTTFVVDGYVSRASAYNFYGGFFPHEVAFSSAAGWN